MKNFVDVINGYREHSKKFANCDNLDVALELLTFPQEISDFWRQYIEKSFSICSTAHGTTEEQCRAVLDIKLEKLLKASETNREIVFLWRILTNTNIRKGARNGKAD
ncbi:hypothetical protein L6259_01375 [Candidatus Parcubacteria bacterium]|nr:hypothetical protein [Candidatus Parcubacteria bacterium]